jgi:hypothetical protein
MQPESVSRVIMALTETSPIDALWRVTLERLQNPEIEFLTLYISDDRWQRAASLPFTREIPRFGGMPSVFTVEQARRIHEAAVERARERIEQLAARAKRRLIFEALSDTDEQRLREIVGKRDSVLIVPSYLAAQPVFACLSESGCQIELVDVVG